jgi:hypothetical protein
MSSWAGGPTEWQTGGRSLEVNGVRWDRLLPVMPGPPSRRQEAKRAPSPIP